jgi:hypothetical protein
MPSHILRNILLTSTKTWNTYSPSCYGSYLPQVQEGLPSAICILPYSNIVPYHTEPPQQVDIEGAGIKKDRRREERSKIEKEEFTVYDQVYHN